uniref:Uncharacterized protein n=1 Tax=Zea mays TaxID=4577 RepID=B6T7S8_MAIZE|nr:hypothetical protein [Zea mays]
MSQLSPAGHMAATLLLILLASAAAAAVSADQQVSACQNDIDALWRSCMSPAERRQQQQQHGERKKVVKAVRHIGLCLPPGGTPCCRGERPEERGRGPRP